MQLLEKYSAALSSTVPPLGMLPEFPAKSGMAETNLCDIRINELRGAIRKNQVTFPSQVPAFPKHDRPDLQQQLAQLYFVRGWSCSKIGNRYRLTRLRVQQILKAWKKRAVEVGYIQTVPPPEMFPPASTDSSIHAVVLSIVNRSFTATPPPIPSMRSADGRAPDGTQPPCGYRPRRRFDVARITSALKELEAGRSAADIADELGVSAGTIHAWQRQNERYLLRRENHLLRDQLAKLGADQTKLIDLITRSDKIRGRAFMPFLRTSPHTESDYRDFL